MVVQVKDGDGKAIKHHMVSFALLHCILLIDDTTENSIDYSVTKSFYRYNSMQLGDYWHPDDYIHIYIYIIIFRLKIMLLFYQGILQAVMTSPSGNDLTVLWILPNAIVD